MKKIFAAVALCLASVFVFADGTTQTDFLSRPSASNPPSGYLRFYNKSGSMTILDSSGTEYSIGVGDMIKSVYDPSNIAEQLVGLTATQTLTNKTLVGPIINTSLNLNYATATTVPYIDASKNVVSSAVTPTELGYLSGVTNSINSSIRGRLYTTTGLLNNALLSINTTNTATFDVTAGSGVIFNYETPEEPSYVTWSAQTGIAVANIATYNRTFVYVDESGTIAQQTSIPTPTQRRNRIYLGVLEHPDRVVISGVDNTATLLFDSASFLYDALQFMGDLVNGHEYSGISGTLGIAKSAGSTLRSGVNRATSLDSPNIIEGAATSPTTIYYMYYDGSAWILNTTGTTSINVTQYNDIASGLTTLSNNYWRIDTVYHSVNQNATVIVIGQAEYASYQAALNAITGAYNSIYPPNIGDLSLRSRMIIKQGATDTSNTDMVTFNSADASGGSSGGSGDMLQEIYDPTGLELPYLSTTGTQTITNKTINADSNTITNIGSTEIKSEIITGQTEKTSVATGDFVMISDGADSSNLKKVNISNFTVGANAIQLQGYNISATAPSNGQQLVYNSTTEQYEPYTPTGTGDVVGPSSAVDSNVAFFNGTTGKAIKDSGLTLSGTNTGDETQTTILTKLGASGVTAGSYTNVSATVDAYGRITAMSSGSGGATGLSFVWAANAMPQDWVSTVWTNIGSNYPTINYDTYSYASMAVDYATAEGLGVFCVGPIPSGISNLTVTIIAAPYSTGATGTTMDWKADIVRMRPGTADTSPTAYTLGSTTMNTTGVTTGTYTLTLSTIGATTGDIIQLVIYPNTGASTPKQTDRMVSLVKIGVE